MKTWKSLNGYIVLWLNNFFPLEQKMGKFSTDICLGGCSEPLALPFGFGHARGAHHCAEFNGFQNMMSILLLFCLFSTLLLSQKGYLSSRSLYFVVFFSEKSFGRAWLKKSVSRPISATALLESPWSQESGFVRLPRIIWCAESLCTLHSRQNNWLLLLSWLRTLPQGSLGFVGNWRGDG